MASLSPTRFPLDYGHVATPALLQNLSGIALAGTFAWTVSDEGRTLECLELAGDGYRLRRQVRLDDLIPGIPGAKEGAELDLESVAVDENLLWICGSHCRVRMKPEAVGELNAEIRKRPSRNLLAAIELEAGGAHLGRVRCAPFSGTGSVRHAVRTDPYLAPFVDLPSKENGFDIEGLAVHRDGVMVGLRGPLLDSVAVVVTVRLNPALAVSEHKLDFLDLGGLAVRDLARNGDHLLVLAGPMNDAPGPFRLYQWQPAGDRFVQRPREVFAWPESREKPEGICSAVRGGEAGLLVLYDRPDASRIRGSTYWADWLAGF